MRLVVDASVAVKWPVEEPDSNIAQKLVASSEDLHAPRLMASEVANVPRRKARSGEIGRGDAGAVLAWVPEMPVRWNADETVSADAIRLAMALDHPVHDCVYLAPAHRIGAVLVTAARRFVKALATTGHRETVVTLADDAGTR